MGIKTVCHYMYVGAHLEIIDETVGVEYPTKLYICATVTKIFPNYVTLPVDNHSTQSYLQG